MSRRRWSATARLVRYSDNHRCPATIQMSIRDTVKGDSKQQKNLTSISAVTKCPTGLDPRDKRHPTSRWVYQ
jgi:hypothetical protein